MRHLSEPLGELKASS